MSCLGAIILINFFLFKAAFNMKIKTIIFSINKHDLGRANNFTHKISLKNKAPVYVPQYRLADMHKQALDKQIDEWLKIGVIQPTASRYNSPIFVVPKKNGENRYVLDYRALNANSHDDRYTMRTVDECIAEIGKSGSAIFSTKVTCAFLQ